MLQGLVVTLTLRPDGFAGEDGGEGVRGGRALAVLQHPTHEPADLRRAAWALLGAERVAEVLQSVGQRLAAAGQSVLVPPIEAAAQERLEGLGETLGLSRYR